MHISYNYGAGDALAQAMKMQAQQLGEHSHELYQSGTALVSEYFRGIGSDAYIASLQRLTNALNDLADTIVNHSGAVTGSFGDMSSTDTMAAQMLGG
jgi:uncharacterized protein YukE